jgi:large subunit ribosomal protein L22
MHNIQSAYAIGKYVKMSPHKVRRILNQIKNRPYKEALMILEFMPYRSCVPIWKVLHSALANGINNFSFKEASDVKIISAYANEGPKLKRIEPRAKGQANKILKPTCHIMVKIESVI